MNNSKNLDIKVNGKKHENVFTTLLGFFKGREGEKLGAMLDDLTPYTIDYDTSNLTLNNIKKISQINNIGKNMVIKLQEKRINKEKRAHEFKSSYYNQKTKSDSLFTNFSITNFLLSTLSKSSRRTFTKIDIF